MASVNGLSAFYASWACGVAGLTLDVDAVIAVGGVLLLVAAALLLTHANDPLARKLSAASHGFAGRAFFAALLAFMGLGWLTFALAPS